MSSAARPAASGGAAPKPMCPSGRTRTAPRGGQAGPPGIARRSDDVHEPAPAALDAHLVGGAEEQ